MSDYSDSFCIMVSLMTRIPFDAGSLRWAYMCFIGSGDSHGSITMTLASSLTSSTSLAAGKTFSEQPMMIMMSASRIAWIACLNIPYCRFSLKKTT